MIRFVKHFLFVGIIIVFCFKNSFAQTKITPSERLLTKQTIEAQKSYTKYFNNGVVFLNKNELDSAISNFTIAISNYEFPDAYFNRAIANIKQGNKSEFCKDLNSAKRLNDHDADSLYCKKCITRDTVFFDSLGRKTNAEFSSKFVSIEKSRYDSTINLDTIYRNSDGFYYLSLYKHISVKCKNPSTVLPIYLGGQNKIYTNRIFLGVPFEIVEEFGRARTNCSFRISPNGDIQDIKYISGIDKYNSFTKNRLLKLAKWTPAMLNGEYADVELIINISNY